MGLSSNFSGMIGSVSSRQKAVFLLVDVLRHEEFHEVTDGRGDDPLVVFVDFAFLGTLPRACAKSVATLGFFGDDERFHAGGERIGGSAAISSHCFYSG